MSKLQQTMVLETLNPLDLSLGDLEDLAAALRPVLTEADSPTDVDVRGDEPEGAGNTWVDVLVVLLPNAEFIKDRVFGGLIDVLIAFMRKRFRRPHERQRPRMVCLYGPDGRILKKVQLDDEASEPRWDDEPVDDLPFS